MDTLATRLNRMIKQLGLRKNEFAKIMGVSPAYISMLTNGKKTNPSIRFIESLQRNFGANPAWLLEGKGNMFFPATLGSIPNVDDEIVRKYSSVNYHSLSDSERALIDELVLIMLKYRKLRDYTP